MRTRTIPPSEVERLHYVVDAEDKVLGRLATQVATLLRGKGKVSFSPNVDVGDFVVVVNAAKVRMTGKKMERKTYFRHSGYPGGARFTSVRKLMETKPEEVVRRAVKGMLPKNRLGRTMLRKLKVYAGPEHPHQAQKPEPYEV